MNLPPPARAKLNALAAAADDLAVLTGNALAQLKNTEATLAIALWTVETDAEKAEAEALAAEVERLRSSMDERRAQRDGARQLVTRLRSWLDKLPPNSALGMVAAPDRERRDETARAAVERHRALLGGLREQMEAARKAPLTHAEVRQFVHSWVRQHADRGRPHIAVNQDRADILFESTRALVPGDRHVAAISPDLFVHIFRDEVTQALLREADALTLKGAMTRDERAARLLELRAALLDVERAEEAAIVRAANEGTIIARRGDADPRAVLGVEIVGAVDARAA